MFYLFLFFFFFFFNDTATTEIYTLSLHDALPILRQGPPRSRSSRTSHTPSPTYRTARSRRPPRSLSAVYATSLPAFSAVATHGHLSLAGAASAALRAGSGLAGRTASRALGHAVRSCPRSSCATSAAATAAGGNFAPGPLGLRLFSGPASGR